MLLVACNDSSIDNTKQSDAAYNPLNNKERLENINQYLTEKDKDVIECFIRRQGWHMNFSPDGYFYEVYNTGDNVKATEGKQVEYSCSVSLLDGTVCYKEDKPKEFVVGRSEEISGLHLALKYLGKGGKAKFIFPPQLAYGLQGDMNKIPARSVVVYDVNVLAVK